MDTKHMAHKIQGVGPLALEKKRKKERKSTRSTNSHQRRTSSNARYLFEIAGTILIFYANLIAANFASFHKTNFARFIAPSVACLVLAMPTAHAVDWKIIPSVVIAETYSDNAFLDQNNLARKAWISEITPGIRIEHVGKKSTLFLDYRLHNIYYSDNRQQNNKQNDLSSRASLEVIDNWFFFDAQANISQQNRSAFGSANATDAGGFSVKNNNRVETTAYQASPNIRGKFWNIATYQIRFNQTNSDTNDLALPNTNIGEWLVSLKSIPSSSSLSWAIEGNTSSVQNQIIGSRQDNRAVSSLIYAVDPQLILTILGGRENTNYLTANRQESSISGFGIEWAPSPRTQFAAIKQRRFFGDAHVAIFTHRTPLTVWRFASGQDIVLLPNSLATNSSSSLSNLMFDLLVSAIPDPAMRKDEVSKRIEQTAIPPNPLLGGGFLTARPSVNRVHEASAAIVGAVNTLTFTFSKKNQRSLIAGNIDANRRFFDDIEQRNFNIALSHKLTPITNIVFLAAQLRTYGLAADHPEAKQTVFSLFLNTPLGSKTSIALGTRRVKFSSSVVASYRENALVALLTLRF